MSRIPSVIEHKIGDRRPNDFRIEVICQKLDQVRVPQRSTALTVTPPFPQTTARAYLHNLERSLTDSSIPGFFSMCLMVMAEALL